MEIFDTHAHYDDPAFDSDRDRLLDSLPSLGVTGVIAQGTTYESSEKASLIARRYGYIYFAAGIHPEEVENSSLDDLEKIKQLVLDDKKAVAIGEIGLDYHCPADRRLQLEFFYRQLAMANEIGKPVCVHDRDAHADTLEAFKKYRPRGVVHCYSGSIEMAKELLNLGLYFGFTGAVTFKNNKRAPAVAEFLPLDRILVETDCPYMAPEPLRGRRSDSGMVRHTIARIAAIKGIDADTAAQVFSQNARELFGIRG